MVPGVHSFAPALDRKGHLMLFCLNCKGHSVHDFYRNTEDNFMSHQFESQKLNYLAETRCKNNIMHIMASLAGWFQCFHVFSYIIYTVYSPYFPSFINQKHHPILARWAFCSSSWSWYDSKRLISCEDVSGPTRINSGWTVGMYRKYGRQFIHYRCNTRMWSYVYDIANIFFLSRSKVLPIASTFSLTPDWKYYNSYVFES